MLIFSFILTFLLSCLLSLKTQVTPVQASQPQVIISEVYPAPSSGNHEWIELYNPSPTTAIDLTNWSLYDQLSNSTKIYGFTEEVSLEPQAFRVAELAQPKLNNEADGVILLNHQEAIIDQMSYNSTQAERSWSLNSQQEFVLTIPTRGEPNFSPEPSSSSTPSPAPTPTPTPTPSSSPTPTPSPTPSPSPDTSWQQKISIASFIACPQEDETEAVTLYNADTQAHTLIDWRLRDASQQTRKVDLTINSQDKATISWSNNLLNNDGDTIQLENANGEIVDQLSYQDCFQSSASTETDQDQAESNQNKSKQDNQLDSSNTSDPDPNPTSKQKLQPKQYPVKPQPPYDFKKILLATNSTQLQNLTTPNMTQFTTKPPPLLAIANAILGGCLLLIRHGWPLWQDISRLYFGQA